ncbi:GspH/FimT family pseudopilin [Pseudomonas paeninsulae]|uniref:GspH/FimT family pseudopilin n=1 Tax=Pseudomonas paeninsulae TaxID=3110772 RepID=UPI002D76A1EC|nr:GspH/FimT family pseudopilin [Pseudomonas sp. IT1137]
MSKCNGFTLMELMIGLVVLAILVGIAIPSYKGMVANQRVRATTTDLHSALVLARSEAIKRNRQVTLSPAATGGWGGGWSIIPSGGAAILSQVLTGGVAISGPAAAIAFKASGRVGAEAKFEVSSTSDAAKLSCLTLGVDGRVSSAKGGC